MNTLNNPIVSVIVPVYNQENYLDRCIQSILSQDYKTIEVILVDDGSTDSSKEIINRLELSDNRVKAYYKTNGGLSDARNYGINKASGTYILFVDADDWIDYDMVSTMLIAMEKNNADMVICEYFKNHPDGQECVAYDSGSEYSVLSTEEMLELLLCDDEITFHAWRRLYKRSLIDNDVFPKGHNYEDAYAVPIMSIKCHIIVSLNKPLYHYWQNPAGISSTFTFENKMDYLLSFEHSFQLIEDSYPNLKKKVAISREKHAMVAWDNYLVVNLENKVSENSIIDKIIEMLDNVPSQFINHRMRFVNWIVRKKYPKPVGRFIYRLFVMRRSLE